MKGIWLGFLVLVLTGCAMEPENKGNSPVTADIQLSRLHAHSWPDLGELLDTLAVQGHCQITINDVYIYLPPVRPYGQGTKKGPFAKEPFELVVPSQEPREERLQVDLSGLKKWINSAQPEAVSLEIGKQVSIAEVLCLLQFLNDERIHYWLMREQLDSDSILVYETSLSLRE